MINAFSPIRYTSSSFGGNRYHIVKKAFNYSTELNSVQVRPYTGTLEKTAGLSTEKGYGGGYISGSLDTPLSTTDLHTCAFLNLVNTKDAKQVGYHVYDQTPIHRIEEFIKKIFPNFTHVNIVGGQQMSTVSTMRKIISAVERVNKNAKKVFYETITENPEVVAHNGKISYIEGKRGQLSFVQDTEHYWY